MDLNYSLFTMDFSHALLSVAIFFVLVYITIAAEQYFGRWVKPYLTSQEYINYYKVGRIKQYAKTNNIDIDKIIAYETVRDKKNMRRTWEEKFEAELSKDLDVEDWPDTGVGDAPLANKAKEKK